jgi:hypothetical protein
MKTIINRLKHWYEIKVNRLKHWYEIKMEGPPVPKYLSGKQKIKVDKNNENNNM